MSPGIQLALINANASAQGMKKKDPHYQKLGSLNSAVCVGGGEHKADVA